MKKSVSFLVSVVTLSLMTLVVMIASCSKSGSSAKPKISIESINSPIQPGEPLDVKLNFSNGDNLSGGTYTVIRIRTNQIPPQNLISGDTVTGPIPTYNNVTKGGMEYTQPYQGYLHFDDHINDTLIFKFVVVSSSGVASDTLTTDKIVSISP